MLLNVLLKRNNDCSVFRSLGSLLTFKVNVPMPILIEDDNEEENLFREATSDNWKDICRQILILEELNCLNPGCLINDLVIDAFLR